MQTKIRRPLSCYFHLLVLAAALGALLLTPSTSRAEHSEDAYYTVASGDTLGKVAKKYNCKLQALRRENRHRVKNDVIHPGDRLRVPGVCRGEGARTNEPLVVEAAALPPELLPSSAPLKAPEAVKNQAAPIEVTQTTAPVEVAKAEAIEKVAPSEPPSHHVVAAGDTLGAIAQKYHCSLDAIRGANRKIRRNIIHPGERLRIPSCDQAGDAVALSPAQKKVIDATAEKPAQKKVIGAMAEKPAQKKVVKELPGLPDIYTVKVGDSLGKIAQSHRCSTDALRDANPKVKRDLIHPGQTLTVPSCSSASAALMSWSGVIASILPRLMKRRGFRAPGDFKAMVIEVSFDRTREHIVQERRFDYKGTSKDRGGWNPASTIKLFAVISAMQRVRAEGFSTDARLTYHGHRGKRSFSLKELIESTLIESNNISYNRLVQLAGFDRLNSGFLTAKNGFAHSALNKAYEQGKWTRQGEKISLRFSPKITLNEEKRQHSFKARRGTTKVDCYSSACTTLGDLAEGMRRLMLQEQLPASKTFGLHREDLMVIRKAMRAHRRRGNEVIDAFGDVFNDDRMMFYSKPGYSNGWFSDNVYIYDPTSRQAWIVVMAGAPGRRSLNKAAKVIAEIIKSGELRKSKP